ncbi:hypothetical protein BDZ97DRAFT_1752319 [Flammula alnicola]|nr:hypothetical protein BDZ97DRAFT_1752319 [Flammula alnicola]
MSLQNPVGHKKVSPGKLPAGAKKMGLIARKIREDNHDRPLDCSEDYEVDFCYIFASKASIPSLRMNGVSSHSSFMLLHWDSPLQHPYILQPSQCQQEELLPVSINAGVGTLCILANPSLIILHAQQDAYRKLKNFRVQISTKRAVFDCVLWLWDDKFILALWIVLRTAPLQSTSSLKKSAFSENYLNSRSSEAGTGLLFLLKHVADMLFSVY